MGIEVHVELAAWIIALLLFRARKYSMLKHGAVFAACGALFTGRVTPVQTDAAVCRPKPSSGCRRADTFRKGESDVSLRPTVSEGIFRSPNPKPCKAGQVQGATHSIHRAVLC